MKQAAYRFLLAASLYWFCTGYAGRVLALPPDVVSVSAFLPPVLGLMWGPAAALGASLGGILAVPGLWQPTDAGGWLRLLGQALWVFLAGYLPCRLWHGWRVPKDGGAFPLGTGTLLKFLAVLLMAYAVAAAIRGWTATAGELAATAGWMGTGIPMRHLEHVLGCFASDYGVAVFFGLPWFFSLVRCGYPFYSPKGSPEDLPAAGTGHAAVGSRKAWLVAMVFYGVFLALFVYLDLVQIYGMDRMATWLRFTAECLMMMDIVLALLLYLVLRFRHSIMMEIVFLVALTVFFSAGVLGWGSSAAMGHFVTSHAEDSLRAMSVICRERLDRTFQCVRQAVNGMERQASISARNYDRLAQDLAYRESYLAAMEQMFGAIAAGTDGSIAYYLRLAPEVAGTMGGFSMGREAARWEGALSPFVRRVPIDLARYPSDDVKNVGWYYIPKQSGHASWIEPYIDPTSRNYVISYVAPLYVDGRFLGVIGMDIDFEFIIKELRRMSIYDFGYTYIMNRNGIVLYHRDYEQGSVFRPNPQFQEMEIYLTNGMWLGIAMPLTQVHEERNRVVMHEVAAILLVAMLVSLGSILLVSRVVRPLAGVTEAAERIAAGDLRVSLDYEMDNEVGTLVKSIREMAARLEVYVYRDKLTGLRNAAAYMSKIAEIDARQKSSPSLRYGVVIFDANFLKRINDRYGHDAGNELIRHAAHVICRVFAHSPVYRIGGDEFAAVLEGEDYERREALLQLFDEQAARERFEAGGKTHTVSVARGLAVHAPGMDFVSVAKQADAAMYAHKAAIKAALGEDVR